MTKKNETINNVINYFDNQISSIRSQINQNKWKIKSIAAEQSKLKLAQKKLYDLKYSLTLTLTNHAEAKKSSKEKSSSK